MGMGEVKVKYHFLLGGYDLEMVEIRQLLEANLQKFTDLGLSWGARLSAYHDLFNDDEHFVGIELTEDVTLPLHYTSIDHHNENSHRPSAIEQVAELLGIELTRYQLLVAANDSGYIPGMEAMGASKADIEEIRQADRKAQGVTEDDEELAKLSIRENLTQVGALHIVEAKTPRFSAITDRLYPYRNLLITFRNQLVFYGEGKEKLVKDFYWMISKGQAFHGGNETGFFGLVSDAFSEKETIEIRNKIIKLLTEATHV